MVRSGEPAVPTAVSWPEVDTYNEPAGTGYRADPMGTEPRGAAASATPGTYSSPAVRVSAQSARPARMGFSARPSGPPAGHGIDLVQVHPSPDPVSRQEAGPGRSVARPGIRRVPGSALPWPVGCR